MITDRPVHMVIRECGITVARAHFHITHIYWNRGSAKGLILRCAFSFVEEWIGKPDARRPSHVNLFDWSRVIKLLTSRPPRREYNIIPLPPSFLYERYTRQYIRASCYKATCQDRVAFRAFLKFRIFRTRPTGVHSTGFKSWDPSWTWLVPPADIRAVALSSTSVFVLSTRRNAEFDSRLIPLDYFSALLSCSQLKRS